MKMCAVDCSRGYLFVEADYCVLLIITGGDNRVKYVQAKMEKLAVRDVLVASN
ncbi:hypothetical protein BH10CHL1_BH10CHL1_20520 [soil metagenome]